MMVVSIAVVLQAVVVIVMTTVILVVVVVENVLNLAQEEQVRELPEVQVTEVLILQEFVKVQMRE